MADVGVVIHIGRTRRRADGLGAKARIRQPRLPTVVWEVTKWEPGRSWTWTTTSPGARTEASHVLSRVSERTIAEQSITWSGPIGWLAAFVWRSVTRRYLAIEANGLKQRSEQVAISTITGGDAQPQRHGPMADA